MLVGVTALLLVAPGIAAPAALAAGEVVTIQASASPVDYEEPATLTGSVTGDAACTAGRAVQLEWRPADSAAWAVVAQGQTAADGTFSFTSAQQYTGSYRADLPETPPCAAVSSDPVLVRVRALVDVVLLAGSLTAGSCVDLDVTVSPNKAGQTVDMQRRASGGWTTIQSLTLDDLSQASTRPCFGWEDVGIVRLRVRWAEQDVLNVTAISVTLPFQISEGPWMERIGELVGNRSMSVSLGQDGTFLYERADAATRIPASNEKLLLSMALLDTFGADHRIVTHAAVASPPESGVVQGDLWILGRGDPEVARGRIATLARRIADAGITKVRGQVMGSTSFFRHDWWAEGWRPGISRDYVALPTALTFEGNVEDGGHVLDPELRAARALTGKLRSLGVVVTGKPGSGREPDGLTDVATVASRSLEAILTRLDRPSNNFYAEVLGKLLAVQVSGAPGTIGKGAAAVAAWTADHGVTVTAYDSSGLSYDNRVTAEGIVRLLWVADGSSWGRTLRFVLPKGGQGTLRDRFDDVTVRAKTGTLDGISALSGWVWLEHEETWAEFSILSSGMSKSTASRIEDRIVRTISRNAR